MLDLKMEVIQEMTKSAFHLYNRSTEWINEQSKAVEIEVKGIKTKMENLFASMPDITPIEDEDVNLLEKIAGRFSEDHPELPTNSNDSDKDFSNVQQSLSVVDKKLQAVKAFLEWIDENRPKKSNDEDLEALLIRARKILHDCLQHVKEFEKALVRYKHVIAVTSDTLEVLIDQKLLARSEQLPDDPALDE